MDIDLLKARPINGNVIVKQEQSQNVSKSGIIVDLGKKRIDRRNAGEVIAVDPDIPDGPWLTVGAGGPKDLKFINKTLQKGDKIVFSKYAGAYYQLDNQDFIVLKYDEILMIDEHGIANGGEDHSLQSILDGSILEQAGFVD